MFNMKGHKLVIFVGAGSTIVSYWTCEHPLLTIVPAVCRGTSNTPQKSVLPSNNRKFKQPTGLEKLVLGLMQLQVVSQDLTHHVNYSL